MKSIAIFIPALNVAHALPSVLDRIPEDVKKYASEIFVIDNDSSDDTYNTVLEYKKKNVMENLQIYKNETNLGYGGSQKKAHQYAIRRGFDILVILHSDGQYPPEFIHEVIRPLQMDEADLVWGSRMLRDPLGGGMPYWRYLGNRFLTWVMNTALGLNLAEFHSGFQAFSVSAVRKVPFQLLSNNYDFHAELIIQFALAGMRISEIPIPTHYGRESRSPTVTQSFTYGMDILKHIFWLLMHKSGVLKQQKYDLSSYSFAAEPM